VARCRALLQPPYVSDDNPYSQGLFRTLKHSPSYPRQPFADLAAAHGWVQRFVAWYNGEHRQSGIRFVTPNERHFGLEQSHLARRHELYEKVRRRRPERWSRCTRNWTPVALLLLNPEQPQRGQVVGPRRAACIETPADLEHARRVTGQRPACESSALARSHEVTMRQLP